MLIIFPNIQRSQKNHGGLVDHWPDCRSISSPSSVTLSQQLVYEPIISYRRNLVQTMNLQGHLSQSSTCTKNSLSSLWYYKYSLHALMSCHVKSFPVNKIYFIYRLFQFVSKLKISRDLSQRLEQNPAGLGN